MITVKTVKTVKESQLEWIAGKSFINCHAMGVDSVLFDDTPGARVRAFIAQKSHDLWRNGVYSMGPLSVAFHPHHCAVQLKRIHGIIHNITPVVADCGETYREYKYISPIGKGVGVGKFEATGEVKSMFLKSRIVKTSLKMKASDMHTVYVPRGETAAWFVYEGEENAGYEPLCWSNDDLERFDFAPYYRPMGVEYLRVVLEQMRVGVEARGGWAREMQSRGNCVSARTDCVCAGCGKRFTEYDEIELGHIEGKGLVSGKRNDAFSNLCLLHKAENREQGSMSLADYKAKKGYTSAGGDR